MVDIPKLRNTLRAASKDAARDALRAALDTAGLTHEDRCHLAELMRRGTVEQLAALVSAIWRARAIAAREEAARGAE